jgi:ABC-type phosphate/phosphonate transport system substrate-binding protein
VIASLPMYDRAETAAANDRLWTAIRTRLGEGPATLSRDLTPEQAWRHPDLILSQTCGLPFALDLHRHVTLIGAPDFRLDGCPPGTYCSVIVTRKDDERPVPKLLCDHAILNDRNSQSGHNALLRFAQRQGAKLGAARISGAHRASAKAVAEGHAGIAAIDANTWRLIERWDDWASDLTIIDRTPPTPAMPFIAGPKADMPRVHDALRDSVDALPETDKTTLGLFGIVTVSKDAYLAVTPPQMS